jgi:hypothetical protein
VTVEEAALILSVVFAGVWSGLLLMLTTVLHSMIRRLDGRGFALFLRAFLPVARRAPANYIAVLGMVIAPAVALIALGDDRGRAAFVLTAIGLVLCVAGPLLVSRLLSEPNYDVMLGWDPDALPDDWPAVQAYYFRLNWIRTVITWTAFGLFLAALVALLD